MILGTLSSSSSTSGLFPEMIIRLPLVIVPLPLISLFPLQQSLPRASLPLMKFQDPKTWKVIGRGHLTIFSDLLRNFFFFTGSFSVDISVGSSGFGPSRVGTRHSHSR